MAFHDIAKTKKVVPLLELQEKLLPHGKYILEFVPGKKLLIEQFSFTGYLQYTVLENKSIRVVAKHSYQAKNSSCSMLPLDILGFSHRLLC